MTLDEFFAKLEEIKGSYNWELHEWNVDRTRKKFLIRSKKLTEYGVDAEYCCPITAVANKLKEGGEFFTVSDVEDAGEFIGLSDMDIETIVNAADQNNSNVEHVRNRLLSILEPRS